jgi:hypothetical protein
LGPRRRRFRSKATAQHQLSLGDKGIDRPETNETFTERVDVTTQPGAALIGTMGAMREAEKSQRREPPFPRKAWRVARLTRASV